jgi:hypothetical protein
MALSVLLRNSIPFVTGMSVFFFVPQKGLAEVWITWMSLVSEIFDTL